jgi:hypothetical protein
VKINSKEAEEFYQKDPNKALEIINASWVDNPNSNFSK